MSPEPVPSEENIVAGGKVHDVQRAEKLRMPSNSQVDKNLLRNNASFLAIKGLSTKGVSQADRLNRKVITYCAGNLAINQSIAFSTSTSKYMQVNSSFILHACR